MLLYNVPEEGGHVNAWENIVSMIKSEGVEFIFGIGDCNLQLYGERAEGIQSVGLRYEGSAPFMAMAYSRLSGRPGVCTASPGPGTANILPGVLEAYSGSLPLIVISSGTSQQYYGMGDFQECDMVSMMEPVTKWCARVPYLDRIPWFIRRAFSVAVNGQPGPVYIEIPFDITGKTRWDLHEVETHPYLPSKKIRTAGDQVLIKEAIGLLKEAEKPVAVCGGGAVLSDAGAEFQEFVELLGIPFLTTPGGRGLVPETHPLALGVCGIYRTKVGKQVFSDADLVMTIGSKNESFSTHQWEDMPKDAKFIQIDIEPFEIGRNWLPDVGIAGDAKLVLGQLIKELKNAAGSGGPAQIPRVAEIVSAKEAYRREVEIECVAAESPLPAKHVVFEANRVFGDSTVLVSENGSQDTWSYCYPYYAVLKDGACVPVAEQTCMGMGVVGAIAAKLAAPEKNVLCFTGDGAFQMYMKEVPTACQYKAGCTWVVLNNSSFGWIKDHQQKAAGWDAASFAVQPDFVKWADACGCYGKRVETASELETALEGALEANRKGRPAIVDAAVGLDLSHFDRSK